MEAKGRQAIDAERAYGRRFATYAEYRRTIGRDARGRFQYRFYRFVPSRVKVLDEREFGSGVFVTASLRRTRARKGAS
jgi:hypothetical protein